MTTGAKHQRLIEISVATEGDEERRSYATCRCAIGVDHDDPELLISQYNPNEEAEEAELDKVGEPLSASEAADIWRSRGEDEDYTFGYDEDELRRAADEG